MVSLGHKTHQSTVNFYMYHWILSELMLHQDPVKLISAVKLSDLALLHHHAARSCGADAQAGCLRAMEGSLFQFILQLDCFLCFEWISESRQDFLIFSSQNILFIHGFMDSPACEVLGRHTTAGTRVPPWAPRRKGRNDKLEKTTMWMKMYIYI